MLLSNNMRDSHFLDELFASARKYESALDVSLQLGDELASMMAAARLKRVLDRGCDALKKTLLAPAIQASLQAMFSESSRGMRELLPRAHSSVRSTDVDRLLRWIRAPGRSDAITEGPDLFEVDSCGVSLDDTRLFGLYVVRCRLITFMRGAHLLNAYIDETDLTYSNLDRSVWQATETHRSHFADTSFVDASFENVTLVGCDLRRADFSVTGHLPVVSNIRFVRCDLRGAKWGARDLGGATMVDCMLDEVCAPASAPYVDIRSSAVVR